MNNDLKQIKKLYGEAMMHFCRNYFSTILDESGKLLKILQNNFAPSHVLYADLVKKDKITEFKDFVYDIFYNSKVTKAVLDVKTPQELLKQAGYILYECKTEDDIQTFKKYYAKGEELCTFNGGRLNHCYVFFAVKENVDEVKREDFSKPERQDFYGTSVISIQFSRDGTHTLSIKNRYNHRVLNPDATFSNNLDNIIEGLTESFEKYYGMKQEYRNASFELSDYVRANDGRWYKYNYEDNNIYYCPDNIIIDNGKVIRYEKEKYVIMDYLILDLVEKRLYLYDEELGEPLPNVIGKIKRIAVVKKGEEKEITIINEKDEEIKIIVNTENCIVGLMSKDIKQVGDNFLSANVTIKNLYLPNLVQVGDDFLRRSPLVMLSLPSLQQVGTDFLDANFGIDTLDLPELQKAGDNFLFDNMVLTSINLPKLKEVGDSFLYGNYCINTLNLPELIKVGTDFMFNNEALISLDLPNLRWIGDYFMRKNANLSNVELPMLQQVGVYFLANNQEIGNKILAQIKEQQGLKR